MEKRSIRCLGDELKLDENVFSRVLISFGVGNLARIAPSLFLEISGAIEYFLMVFWTVVLSLWARVCRREYRKIQLTVLTSCHLLSAHL